MAKKSMAINLAICYLASNWTMLYFIKSGDYCKVGYSRDSKAFFTRMRTYLTHNPSFQILDLQKGDKTDEQMLHAFIPKQLYHYGEWCVWDKEIAQIWIDYFNIKSDKGLEGYFYNKNKNINKAIVNKYKSSPYLNFVRYFSKESNLDLSESKDAEWRVHE